MAENKYGRLETVKNDSYEFVHVQGENGSEIDKAESSLEPNIYLGSR